MYTASSPPEGLHNSVEDRSSSCSSKNEADEDEATISSASSNNKGKTNSKDSTATPPLSPSSPDSSMLDHTQQQFLCAQRLRLAAQTFSMMQHNQQVKDIFSLMPSLCQCLPSQGTSSSPFSSGTGDSSNNVSLSGSFETSQHSGVSNNHHFHHPSSFLLPPPTSSSQSHQQGGSHIHHMNESLRTSNYFGAPPPSSGLNCLEQTLKIPKMSHHHARSLNIHSDESEGDGGSSEDDVKEEELKK